MNLKPALRLSVDVAPAEAALRRAETMDELQDAWFVECDNFNGARREHLQNFFDERASFIREADRKRAELQRLARAL